MVRVIWQASEVEVLSNSDPGHRSLCRVRHRSKVTEGTVFIFIYDMWLKFALKTYYNKHVIIGEDIAKV